MADSSQIDKLILQAAGERWLKVARIIAVVAKETGSDLSDDERDLEIISQRINHLVQDGLLEAQGNTANWRFSEIRLPDPADSND